MSKAKFLIFFLVTTIGSLFISMAASAQYFVDPTVDEIDTDHVRYFGAAIDEKGKRQPDVTITLQAGNSIFVYVTGEDGRFVGALPTVFAEMPVKAACAKSGYEMVRSDSRPGIGRGTFQVDCRLRKSN